MRKWILALLFVGLNHSALGAVEETTADQANSAVVKEEVKSDPYKGWIGTHVGLGLSNASVSQPSTQRAGLMAGAFYEAPLLPGFLYFQPEVNFTQKGAFNTFFSAGDGVRFNYLEVPMLAKIKFMIPRVRPFALGGFSLGYMIGSSSANGTALSSLNPFEAAFVVGAGVSFEMGDGPDSMQLNFSARYSQGLTPVATVAGVNWYSNIFVLLLGVQI
ncbi:PorT family protein [bacterium]|nr:PorT family protein [bacterium]